MRLYEAGEETLFRHLQVALVGGNWPLIELASVRLSIRLGHFAGDRQDLIKSG